MPQKAAGFGSGLVPLRQAGILGTIAEMLDKQTILVVICHVDEFCRSITMVVVERTLKELFGQRWRAYYDAYASRCHEVLGQATGTPSFKSRTHEPHPWGLGYDLRIPPETSMVSGYAVMMAIQTLNAIALNCENYDYSFIPGEPSECGINRISFVENGRLVWIQYRPKSYDYRRRGDIDVLNDEMNHGFYEDVEDVARLDGQVVLRNDAAARRIVATPGSQETCPKKVDEFEMEVWDIGARPHPHCLWSSLWEAALPTSQINAHGLVTPLRRFSLAYFDGFLMPSMRGFLVLFNDRVSDLFPNDPCQFPDERPGSCLRFVQCVSTHEVIDLLQLESIQFRQTKKLYQPHLSNDLRYLGAVVRMIEHGQIGRFLAVWSVALPRSSLLWKNGVKLPCKFCTWFIDRDWLLILCRVHGTSAYCLFEPAPVAIDLTSCVPSVGAEAIALKVCGVYDDILACDSPSTKSFWFVKLKKYEEGGWSATRLYLSLDSVKPSNRVAPSLGSGATSYIHNIGMRYCLSTTGNLFDLGLGDAIGETTPAVRLQAINPNFLKVIQIWESPDRDSAVTVCYDSRMTEPVLMFWLFDAYGRHHRVTAYGASIRYRDVRLVLFSPDGKKMFVCSQRVNVGWLVLINSTPKRRRPEICIKKIPRRFLDFGWTGHSPTNWPDVCHPVFVTKDTVAITNNACLNKKVIRVGDATMAKYTFVAWKVVLARIDEKTLALNCSDICVPSSQDYDDWTNERLYAPRWVDVLREKTRDLDYCASITSVGMRPAISPSGRFLLYPTERDLQRVAAPHVELCDLCLPQQKRPKGFRRSWNSFLYCVRLRKDYRRVNIYMADRRRDAANANSCNFLALIKKIFAGP